MDNQIKAGDIVKLKSNSIPMTVESISGDLATCIFWNAEKHEFANEKVVLEALVKVQ